MFYLCRSTPRLLPRSLAQVYCPVTRSRNISAALVPANHLNDFNVNFRSPLGVGSCGAVYSAEHQSTQREVAIKVMSPALSVCKESTPEEVAEATEQEIGAINQLLKSGGSHSNVVNVIGCFQGVHDEGPSEIFVNDSKADDTVSYFVMEKLTGDSLQDRILAEGGLGEDRARKITRAVCEGLAFLHEQGIAHRDVCPRNVLYAKKKAADTDVKIIDFSHAGIFPEGVDADEPCFEKHLGTAGFVAPEILTDNQYSAKCDVYSLGCTVHAMLANGKLPRRHPRIGMMTSLPASASSEVKNFIGTVLAANPEDRPNMAEVLSLPWLQQNS